MFVIDRDMLDNFNQSILDKHEIQFEGDEFKQFAEWLAELYIASHYEGDYHE